MIKSGQDQLLTYCDKYQCFIQYIFEYFYERAEGQQVLKKLRVPHKDKKNKYQISGAWQIEKLNDTLPTIF